MEDRVSGFSGLGSHGCIGLLGTDRNHRRTASNRRKSHLKPPDRLWFGGSFGFHTNGSRVLEPSGFSRSGLAGCESRPRRNRHWNRRISVLATVHRGSGPLGFGFSSLSPDLSVSSLSLSVSLLSQSLDVTLSLCGSGEKKNRRGRKKEEEEEDKKERRVVRVF